jgi:hypothetical protein
MKRAGKLSVDDEQSYMAQPTFWEGFQTSCVK